MFVLERDAGLWQGKGLALPPFAHKTREEWGTHVRAEEAV
jgi:hypothetical protein